VTSEPLKKVVFIVTGNIHKFTEARLVLSEFGLSTAMLNVDTIEIQVDTIENVAEASVIDAVKKCHFPVIVEDAGLFIKALKGFPGPYSSYVFRTIGLKGVLKLMENVKERGAFFESVVAFSAPNRKSPKLFRGKTEGRIADQMRGQEGFGFDPIFLPISCKSKTFAEMPIAEKNELSHRAKALRAFAEWYVAGFEVYFR
jgi:XTP/dITP diphosphohydrolase